MMAFLRQMASARRDTYFEITRVSEPESHRMLPLYFLVLRRTIEADQIDNITDIFEC
jgi:hypothetical protein